MNESPEGVHVMASVLLICGLTLLGFAAGLGVIGVLRIAFGGGKVRGYPHAFFAIFWSGLASFAAVAVTASALWITPAKNVNHRPVDRFKSEALFAIDLGNLQFDREIDQAERVARLAADLVDSLQNLRTQLELNQESFVKFDIGIIETNVDSDRLTFRVSTEERNPPAFELIARLVKSLIDQKLDEALMKECKARTWSVSFQIE